jgi:hypothetical protein
VQTPGKGTTVFLIPHRFGAINSGAYTFFGLNAATLRLGFEYAVTDRLKIGIGCPDAHAHSSQPGDGQGRKNDVYARGGSRSQHSVALGVDIETGGSIFQLHVTNSPGMIEKQFITETTGKVVDGDLFSGFNISRNFTVKQRSRKI